MGVQGHDHVDVVIVGAGLSGIGAACHIQRECPDRSYLILEGRADLGGTWDLFRYPGVRSDSDMHTLGYDFKPWTDEKSIADGPAILAYVRETASENGVDRHIRYRHHVDAASWSSDEAQWTVHARNTDTGELVDVTCSFLFMNAGYYSYNEPYAAEIPGIEQFRGTVVHPQFWPEDLDYAGKHVVVIGSGATAMTIVPAMAATAAHVTMLQRSPTYVVARPDRDKIANRLRQVLPDSFAYRLTRKKNITLLGYFYGQTRTKPDKTRQQLLGAVRKELGDEITDAHFTPSYNPWDQRLCLLPNGDLYKSIRDGKASVVTDRIASFTAGAIVLESGAELAADIVVTATGLQLVTPGEVRFEVDGKPVDFSDTVTYRGLAFSDVPNLVSTFGYINASWTMRSDLIARFVCRVLNHMRATGTDQCTPRLRESDHDMPRRPWIDGFTPGYMQRAMDRMPKQGDRAPWSNPQRYKAEKAALLKAPLDDGVLQFTRARTAVTA
jgi:monooxygenase